MSKTPTVPVRDRGEYQSRSAPAERGGRPQRRGGDADRNRRMFANLQNALGGKGATPLPGSSRILRTRIEEPVEELEDLDTVIARISDLTIRADRSAAQIQRDIAHSKFVKEMDEESWEKLCDKLLETALNSGETDFIAGLFVTLLGYEIFQDVFPQKLMHLCSAYIMNGSDESDSIPTFLGKILGTHWPRQYSKAIDTVNVVLYITVSIIKGWIIVLVEDTKAEIEMKAKEDVPPLPDDSDSDNEDEEKEVEQEREDPEIVNRCASAISALCSSMQRTLWLQWPELVDEMYEAIKPAITHNNRISGDAKTSLLQTLISFHSWTKTKAVTTKCSSTQTV